ncbi:MAG: cell division protein ZapA [Alphaproteobacteria bacterium]|nr:cell division protein ZapA [Alphaproteobacteria bacterium]
MSEVTIDINGRKYRIACEDGQEEHVRGLAQKFSGYVDQLKDEFREAGDTRLTIMAGITVVDDMSALGERLTELERSLEELRATGLALSDERTALEEEFSSHFAQLAARINDLAARLENTLATADGSKS